jgi:hypothetical protein
MDMKETEVIHIAIENLKNTAKVEAVWNNNTNLPLDGILTLFIDNQKIEFNTDIKKELRFHQLIQIEKLANTYPPFIIVAERIFPKIKEELRQLNIAYLEANGNIYFHHEHFRYVIEANKPLQIPKEKQNRAFTKTGLKVLFHFLVKPELVNLPHREIAEITQVAHGNIAYILNGLKETGYLARLNKNMFQLMNKKELLQKWAVAYKETLQTNLEIGRFRFANEENFIHWRKVQLQKGKTWWGGEPAGDLLTNYLRPGELTIYTTETRNELMRNYRLIPEPKGEVRIYKKFWNNETNDNNEAVPPLLTYVDLINTGDKRCRETAKIIWDKFLA